jgi:Xaa-Pro aminopeptidase
MIGIDTRMLSVEKSAIINVKIKSLNFKMVYPPPNFVDLIWKNKPPKSAAPTQNRVYRYFHRQRAALLFRRQGTRQKLEKIRNWIRERHPSQPSSAKGSPTLAQKHVGKLISFLPCIGESFSE